MAWPLILQQTSQDLFPWQWLLFSQELKSIKKGKYESTIISQFSACVVFATILLAEARYMANSMEKWGNRLFLDRQTFKIIFLFFFSTFIYFWDRERQSMNGGGAEREGDTESETGSRL